MTIPLVRRFAIAFVALVIAAGLFSGQVAAALVTRGDDAMRSGDRSAAVRYYDRALAIDARSTIAADRLAFSLAQRRSPGDAQAAIAIATRALERAPFDAALLADRALAEQRLGRSAGAQADFARAGEVAHDARYDHLAGRMALARGQRRTARHYFLQALVDDPHFDPARAALARLQ